MSSSSSFERSRSPSNPSHRPSQDTVSFKRKMQKQTPNDRIENLLQSITAILNSYSSSHNASTMYLESLVQFYERAISLSPISPLITPPIVSRLPKDVGQVDTKSLSQTLLHPHPPPTTGHKKGKKFVSSPSSGVRRRRSSQLSLTNIQELPSPDRMQWQVDQESRHENQDKLMKDIEKLEDDWWNSEIVAVWYGPSNRIPPSNLPRKASDRSIEPPSPGLSRRTITPRHNSSPNLRNKQVGSPPNTGQGEERQSPIMKQRRSASFTLLNQYRTKSQRDEWLEPLLSRDAGYVGLNDE